MGAQGSEQTRYLQLWALRNLNCSHRLRNHNRMLTSQELRCGVTKQQAGTEPYDPRQCHTAVPREAPYHI